MILISDPLSGAIFRANGSEIINLPMILSYFKFQCAAGRGDPLEAVDDAVGEVVEGVDSPLVADGRMVRVFDSVGVVAVHIRVRMVQIAFNSKRSLAFGEHSSKPKKLDKI